MSRKIITIDEELCTGCGACVIDCPQGVIEVIDGKAKVVRESQCDGLGVCIGVCPVDAIEFKEVEEEVAVHAPTGHINAPASGGSCPGARSFVFTEPVAPGASQPTPSAPAPSRLTHWPVQMHLLSPTASQYQGTDLLLAADCAGFSVPDFHERFLKGKALAIACPKLDHGREVYIEKLVGMIDQAKVTSITVLMMEVPCCGGLMALVQQAQAQATRSVPLHQIIVGIRGDVLSCANQDSLGNLIGHEIESR